MGQPETGEFKCQGRDDARRARFQARVRREQTVDVQADTPAPETREQCFNPRETQNGRRPIEHE